MTCVNQMHVAVSLGNALQTGSKSCLYKFTELNFLSASSELVAPSWPPEHFWLIEKGNSSIFFQTLSTCASQAFTLARHTRAHTRPELSGVFALIADVLLKSQV